MAYNIAVFNASGRKRLVKSKAEKAVAAVLKGEKKKKASINIIFTDDKEILRLNKQYLNHHYTTDVITFSLGDDLLEGEIYISVDTAEKNAKRFNVSLTRELLRLSIHGALHLAGYDDATDDERHNMHLLENKYLGAEARGV